jgi:hypothetical protein
MITLSAMDKQNFEDLFGMDSGYVIDFSNPSFQRFIKASINIDIYDDIQYSVYASKANKLRQVWNQEPDSLVGKLLLDLLDYYENSNLKQAPLSDLDKKLIEKLRKVSTKLSNNKIDVTLPYRPDDNLDLLKSDIKQSLSQNKPTLCIDRLHTFSVRFIRDVSTNNDIDIKSKNGIFYNLQSLIGQLAKKYEKDNLFQSEFPIRVMKSSISLFEAFNEIRNNKSYAHDNDVVGNIEATFIVENISQLLTFIDKLEKYRIQSFSLETPIEKEDLDSDIPF